MPREVRKVCTKSGTQELFCGSCTKEILTGQPFTLKPSMANTGLPGKIAECRRCFPVTPDEVEARVTMEPPPPTGDARAAERAQIQRVEHSELRRLCRSVLVEYVRDSNVVRIAEALLERLPEM